MRFFDKFRRWIQRLTHLEEAVLSSVVASIPNTEAKVLKTQIRKARFVREVGSRTVIFHLPHRKPVPPIERLVGKGRLVLASVRAQGNTSRFTTVAKVTVADGLIAELIFDTIPWSGAEIINTECQIVGLPHASDLTASG